MTKKEKPKQQELLTRKTKCYMEQVGDTNPTKLPNKHLCIVLPRNDQFHANVLVVSIDT